MKEFIKIEALKEFLENAEINMWSDTLIVDQLHLFVKGEWGHKLHDNACCLVIGAYNKNEIEGVKVK